MVAVLLYAYCTGLRSSRVIERRCVEDVTFRILSGGLCPDHVTIARFRARHAHALAGVFIESLRLCAEAGLVRLGVVALDGTKVGANASLDANRTLAALEKQIAAILDEAEKIDAAEDQRGEDPGQTPVGLVDPVKAVGSAGRGQAAPDRCPTAVAGPGRATGRQTRGTQRGHQRRPGRPRPTTPHGTAPPE